MASLPVLSFAVPSLAIPSFFIGSVAMLSFFMGSAVVASFFVASCASTLPPAINMHAESRVTVIFFIEEILKV